MWRRLLVPDITVAHVCEITPSLLKQHGVRAVVSDLDNTLVPHYDDDVPEEIRAWIKSLHAGGIRVCLASNTRRLPRLERLAKTMEVLCVPRNAQKPTGIGLRYALTLLESAPFETAMVGDQIFTDILAGNRMGFTTVLVNPLSPEEFVGTRLISRRLERFVLKRPR